eukprot:5640012-Amphidinium_carterae.1
MDAHSSTLPFLSMTWSAEVAAACAVFWDSQLYLMPKSSPCHAATCAQTSVVRKQDQTTTM